LTASSTRRRELSQAGHTRTSCPTYNFWCNNNLHVSRPLARGLNYMIGGTWLGAIDRKELGSQKWKNDLSIALVSSAGM
jgi:hypothetical protein